MQEIKAFYLRGKFDFDDWQEVIELLQRIESRHPETDYHAVMLEPKATAQEAMEWIASHELPDGYQREIKVFKKEKIQ